MNPKVGVCSTAHPNAKVYAKLLSQLECVDFIGISHDNVEVAQEQGAAVNAPVRTHLELIDQADGIVICAPTADHGKFVDLAVTNDVAVLCEKPLATSYEKAQHIRNTCEDAGVVAGTSMPLRFSEPVLEAKEAYESGDLGQLVSISGANRGPVPGGWMTNEELSGGGAVMDYSDHIIDLIHWFTGERITEVYAELATRFSNFRVEDTNLLSMELSSGVPCVLDGSWSTPTENDRWGDAKFALIGAADTVSVDCFGQSFVQIRDRGKQKGIESIFWGADPNIAVLRDFVDALKRECQPRSPLSDSATRIAVMEAAYESAESNEPVTVQY